MTCYSPIRAWKQLSHKTANGKSQIVFKLKHAKGPVEEIKLPCGQCIGCRIKKSRQWALRCVHEASLYSRNCFITLTFNEENLDQFGSLKKTDFQKFMKRLRKRYRGYDRVLIDGKEKYPIRYFHCGEYGEKLTRPHHHACLFNFDFEDKKVWTVRQGVRLYRSEELERLWPYGYCTIGDVTFESAAYCARYVVKKINGERAEEHYKKVDPETGEIVQLVPEYITMSRRPGIGKQWYERFSNEVTVKDFVTHRGVRHGVPAYYDKLYGELNEELLEAVKKERRKRVRQEDLRRLSVKRKCMDAKVKRLKRGIE